MTHSQLIERGFAFNSWQDEGESFTEYKLNVGDVLVEISGLTLVEIAIDGSYVVLPITTVHQLDMLLHCLGREPINNQISLAI